jgi:hypothetical protein
MRAPEQPRRLAQFPLRCYFFLCLLTEDFSWIEITDFLGGFFKRLF